MIKTYFEQLEAALKAPETRSPSAPGASQVKRNQILRAAERLFLDFGYRKASVSEVAKKAGVAKGTVYLHFESKADLLMAALTRERIRTLEAFREALDPDLEGPERLTRWLNQILLSAHQMPLTLRLASAEGRTDFQIAFHELGPTFLQDVMERKVTFLSALIEDAIEPDSLTDLEIRKRAQVLISTYWSSGFFQDSSLRQEQPIEEFTHVLVQMLTQGLPLKTDGSPLEREPAVSSTEASASNSRGQT